MHVVALTPPGRFPTVVPDTGQWWSALAADGAYRLARLSANAAWWRVLCSPELPRAVAARPLRRVRWRTSPTVLERAAVGAGAALERLRNPATYDTATGYIAAVRPLAEYLHLLNGAQDELTFSLDHGVRVTRLDYHDSRALVAYARRSTLLSALIAAALREAPAEIELLVVRVTCPEDLLCALIAVEHLRGAQPTLHACLADHGYENFSLSHHLERLRTARTLDRVFDSIIESVDERDALVPALARAVAQGRAPRGYVRLDALVREGFADNRPASHPGRRGSAQPQGEVPYTAPPPVETFASAPIFWMRVSPHRCYWSRCTFCVHNLKYDHAAPPSLGEVPRALDRLTALVNAGYQTFIFADEALSPALLRHFCEGILARGLRLRWSCRCKLERAYTPELFQLMRSAGCYDVLFGLETTSPRLLRRMDKFTEGLDTEAVAAIFQAMEAAGIAAHVNLIGGFPGDTPAEVTASVAFVLRCLRTMTSATYTLNRFVLFPTTPVMTEAARFGVRPVPSTGDMPASFAYRVAPELLADAVAVERLLPSLASHLRQALGWGRFGRDVGAQAAIQLYFTSGHSAIFKTQEANAFANPLLQAV